MDDVEERNTIYCPECGRKVPIFAKRCKNCGSWLEKILNPSTDLLKCPSCGTIVKEEYASFCPECGLKIQKKNLITGKLKPFNFLTERKEWPKRLAITLAIWGVINLVLTSPIFGGLLIFFAVLIYASRSTEAIYAFAIAWLFLAFIQLVIGATFINYRYYNSLNLILFSIVNFSFAGYTIYETRILNESKNILKSVKMGS